MNNDAYDNSTVHSQWFAEQREHIQAYLVQERIPLKSMRKQPSWFLAPYVSLWQVRNTANQLLWVITGDLPADYLAGWEASTPREAMQAFSSRWERIAKSMMRGKLHPQFHIGRVEDSTNLGEFLLKRAEILAKWSADDSVW